MNVRWCYLDVKGCECEGEIDIYLWGKLGVEGYFEEKKVNQDF